MLLCIAALVFIFGSTTLGLALFALSVIALVGCFVAWSKVDRQTAYRLRRQLPQQDPPHDV
jgi:hypothetical protein